MAETATVRIWYSETESGWAEVLDGNRARIANVPYTERLNIDDVVELLHGGRGGRLRAGRVLKRAFPRKTGITYPEPHHDNFAVIVRELDGRGCRVEGVVHGVCVVAHCAEIEPVSVMRAIGMDVGLLVDESS